MEIVHALMLLLYAVTVLPLIYLIAYVCLTVGVIATVVALILLIQRKRNEAARTHSRTDSGGEDTEGP